MPFITFPRRLSQMFGCLGNDAYLRSIKSLNRKNMSDFMTPPKHVNFRAKKLFEEMGRIPHSCWNNTDGVTIMIGITVI